MLLLASVGGWMGVLSGSRANAEEADLLASGPTIKCTCRFAGRNYRLGQSACFSTGQGLRMARCDKYLNNTTWTLTKKPCPTVMLRSLRPPSSS